MLTKRDKRMKLMTHLVLLAVSVLPWIQLHAASWDSSLYGGGAVSVDPDTNRATVTRDGVTAPLWDGTHRMQDGSVLIIRRGMAVPNKGILDSRKPLPREPEEWEDALIVGYSPCEKLVHRVCGSQDKCCDQEGCNLAQQLLTMEQEERAQSDRHNRMTYTSGQCNNVLHDTELFPYCR